ncbi:[FeFe] hydrogenase H-cluster maturation GTPase HydF [Thermosediminibacter oceani]|uniref:Iron-only hydrogenase maturation protein HydF n=1 Tax=Thermosediminibacter oceani (strain ATCC BAA-1034 / DSM 16646 / JW/IW-1228P) TaxID=555079 RepID=D9RZR6_THEOJ|nr:[FeFe] hydrogenase H-cluster maturation GTPase HydF [Thermosediminibacter oceani]ADL08693.1 iron-only hydrogenase maturation protein HydF [Thermosediminibacter oceani DSM 16646]
MQKSTLNDTPLASRLHIAIFGRRNAGKSSLINAITNQDIALVSSVAGTTTDPVFKAMELLPIGPVVIIDTAGIDDEGELGELRIKKTYQVLNKTDLAVLIIDGGMGVTGYDLEILERIREKNIPVVGVINKSDVAGYTPEEKETWEKRLGLKLVEVSALKRQGIEELKREIINKAPSSFAERPLIGDLIAPGDFVVLVVPIDKAAPKGRLILPQQQTIRDVLDHGAIAVVTKETELKETLKNLAKKPRIVVTDSQAFARVAQDTPRDIPMTSFSILFARYKGDLAQLVEGVKAIKNLKPGDRVLIAEACTHHRQKDDIGTVKIPRWLTQILGFDLDYTWTSGFGFPENLDEIKLVIHCGGCMINTKEMMYRLSLLKQKGIPVVNYGVFIAYATGILERALEPIPEAASLLSPES